MKKLLFALLLTLTFVPAAYAHKGHDHRIMGTVAVIQSGHLEVKAADGKTSSVLLNEKTKIVMGKMAHKVADIKVGDRVVVTATDVKGKDGKPMLIAKQVALGNAASPTVKK